MRCTIYTTISAQYVDWLQVTTSAPVRFDSTFSEAVGEELLAVFHQDCDAIYLCLRWRAGTLFTCMAPCADEPGSPAVAERLRQLVDQRCGYHDGLLLGDDRAKATFRVAN
jgi:hypothetical protein